MTPIGENRCPVLGCRRTRAVSPGGLKFARCWEHIEALLHRAFGS